MGGINWTPSILEFCQLVSGGNSNVRLVVSGQQVACDP